VISRLLRLYPAAWRERYGAEFLRLLQEHPVGPRGLLDVLLGAFDARLHPELVGVERQPLTHRIPGLLALAVGVIWVTWFLNAYAVGPDGEWGEGIGYAIVLMFVAIPGDYLAVHARRIGLGVGAVIGFAVLAWVLPWEVADGFLNLSAGVAGYLVAGAGLVTLAAIRAEIGPRPRWLLLAVTVLLPATVAIPILGGFGPADGGGMPAMLVAALPFGFTWILFGLRMTIRGSATIHDTPPRPRATEVPAT
jgi:hypothetical protein